ncbi:MAG: hypothetical protein H7343_11960, partial [Undibacterium sp.]|nr:hypothetical protein [Opitutaceae bacterium]
MSTPARVLIPLAQPALLCGMKRFPPFVVPGTIRLTNPAVIAQHAADYAHFLTALVSAPIAPRPSPFARPVADGFPPLPILHLPGRRGHR